MYHLSSCCAHRLTLFSFSFLVCLQSVVEFRKIKDQFEVVPKPDLLFRMGFLPRKPSRLHDVEASVEESKVEQKEQTI